MSDADLPAPIEGSSLYYSLMYLPPEGRDRLVRRLALSKAMNETLHEVSEPQVARQKIHWWHEEVDRLLQGTARHPATQAIGAELQGLDCARDVLLASLGVAADQRLLPLATEAERQARLARQAEASIRLALHAVNGDASWLEAEAAIPEPLARAHGEMDQLLQLPRLLHRNYSVFSDELYRQFELSATQLARRVAVAEPVMDGDAGLAVDRETATARDGSSSDSDLGTDTGLSRAQPLYAAVTASALEAFEQVDGNWPTAAGAAPRDTLPLRILSALRERQCRLWLKRKPDLLRERSSLAPLHKLFIAWRCRRRLEHGIQRD